MPPLVSYNYFCRHAQRFNRGSDKDQRRNRHGHSFRGGIIELTCSSSLFIVTRGRRECLLQRSSVKEGNDCPCHRSKAFLESLTDSLALPWSGHLEMVSRFRDSLHGALEGCKTALAETKVVS